MRSSVRRSLAASAVLALTSAPALGAVAPAYAAPDSAAKSSKPAHAGKPAKPAKPAEQEKPAKPAKPAEQEKPAKPGKSDSAKDAKDNPPGNNGTVKIAGPGDAEGHPSNNPHPGCTFFVEWYGFDEGEDFDSTVTFTSQAPTADTVISPATDTVFVGEDAAGGGTDLDGRQEYTLSFDGEPHPQQGYHVKLTVSTPYSHGSDQKSKVFWVEPCDAEGNPVVDEESDEGTIPGVEDTETEQPTDEEAVEETTTVEETDVPEVEVLGIDLFADGDAGDATAATDAEVASGAGVNTAAEVPTSVDAGLAGLGDWTRSPLPLTLAGLGAAAALGGLVYRRRVAGQ